jgi:very-short-patch-repair endonuclease
MNTSHILFEKHLYELGLRYEREVRFDLSRKWRWDFVLKDHRIAVEICGQIWKKGGHSTGKGIQRDYDKANHGTMLGYRVLHFSTEDVMKGKAKAFLQEYL